MANEFKIKKGLIVTGASGGTVVNVLGSQGQLLSVTDNLSGSIFAVSDISGVPILDVNSSGLVTVDGPFTQTGGGATILSGTLNVEGVSTLANVGYLGDGLGSVQYTFQSANDGFATIDFGDVADSNIGRLSYNHNDNSFLIRTNNATALTLDTSQNATFAGSLDVNGTGNNTFTGNILIDNVAPIIQTNSSNNASGFRINVTGIADSTNNLFRVQRTGTTMIDTRGNGNTTFTAQAFSAATSSGDASSTLTTKGYVDSLITGATIYRGTWDPDVSLNSGYGNPDLSGVTQTSGYYYICSDIGTAHPNGTTGSPAVPCEPNSWAVGDWVIWNDDIPDCAGTGTGAWQKIDNSSVLSGVGTGQTVALWEGAGSVTDSETLGNAPITVSGNNATFAGDIVGGGSITIGSGGAYNAGAIFSDANWGMIFRSLQASPNNADFMFADSADVERLRINSTTADFSVTVDAPTFVGDLNGTINTATTGVTQTAGDNSTKIATTAYADAAAAAVPIGNYLPLAGGTLTGGLVGTSAVFGLGVEASQGFFNNVSGIRLLHPNGGSNNSLGNSGTTGAIKITLPVTWTSTMMRMTIKVYEYTTNESFTLHCGGYNYSAGGGSWLAEFAYIESQANLDRNFTIRFGHDGSKCCIYIGELTSVWQYPKVFVTNFEAGFNNITASTWQTGWAISMETTAFGSVTGSFTDTQVNNWQRNGQDLYYGSGTDNVGIGTNTPFTNASDNNGLNIDRGGHSSLLIGDGVNDGGMIQSSDNSQRIIITANAYDSPTGSWSRFTADGAALIDVYGEGTQAFISLNVDNGTTGFPAARLTVSNTGGIQFNTYSGTAKTGTPTYLLGTDVSGNIVKTLTGVPTTGTTQFFNQSNEYNNPTPGITGYGNVSMDTSVSFYDTGKNVPTTVRGIVWTGKHYIITDYNSKTAKFYDNNFNSITNPEASSITLPLASGVDFPHGATWDGRYLYVVQYSTNSSNATIVVYDLDNGTTTATIVNTQALNSLPATFDVEYAEGHLYTCTGGAVSKYKVEGKTITHVFTSTNILGGINAQAITYDGSYLWFTQNGNNGYKVSLDCVLVATITTGLPNNNVAWAWNGQNVASVNHVSGDIYIINTAETRFDTEEFLVMGGDVGIGIDAPTNKLHVYSDANEGIFMQGTGGGHWFNFQSGTSNLWSMGAQAGQMGWYNRTSGNVGYKMIIQDGGNVGINTTSPNKKLEVNGSFKLGTNAYIEYGGVYPYTITTANTAAVGNLVFSAGLGSAAYESKIDLQGTNTAGVAGITLSTAGTARMVVTADGDVGIGTTTPLAKLDIQGTQGQLFSVTDDLSGSIFAVSDISGVPIFDVNSSGVSYFDGNVGIGTSSPQSKLHIETGSGGTYNPNVNHDDVTIEGSGNIGLQLFSPATTYQYIAFGDPDSVNAGYLRYYHTNNEMVFRTNGSDNMVIDEDGNVGIGVTGPVGKLHVGLPAYTNEDTNSQQAIFGASNGYGVRIGYNETDNKGYINVLKPGVAWGSLILQEDVGKVGIGTTSPDEKLTVNGITRSVDQLFFGAINTDNGTYGPYIESYDDKGLKFDFNGNNGGEFQIWNHDANGGGATEVFKIKQDNNIFMPSSNVTIGKTTSALGALDVDGTFIVSVGTQVRFRVFYTSNYTFVNGGTNGSTIYFGAPTTNVQNIRVQGTATATNFILSSDEILKDNIKNIDNKHIDVDWKNFELKSEPGVKRSGVIAQELEEKHPEFVRTDKEGLKSVAYIDLLIAKIAELEARLEKAGI